MKKTNSVLIIYLLFFSMLAPMVSAEETGSSTPAPELTSASNPEAPIIDSRILVETPGQTQAREEAKQNPVAVSQEETVPQVNEYKCNDSVLSDEESQNILDLLKNGYTGKEIVGQTSPNLARETLDNNELILVDPQNPDEGIKTQIPNQKMDPWELSQFLNGHIKGPFALGVVLEDTLRTGRCETFSNEDCAITGTNLKFRNSGAGIVANLKPLTEVFSDIFSGDTNNQFSSEESEALKAMVFTDQNPDSNSNDSQIKTAERLESQLLANSISTTSFEARMQTNCQGSDCVISTYSLFDKYFNSWMSTEMVVSTFGPSLLYQTKKLFGWNARRGFLGGVYEGYQDFLDKFRAQLVTPDSFLGKMRAARIKSRIDSNGWRDWWQSMVTGNPDGSGYELFKTETFQTWWGKQTTKGGFMEGIKTAEQKAEFIRLMKDARSVMRAGQARNTVVREAWEKAAKEFGVDNPVTKKLYIEYGQDTVKWMDNVYDDVLGADFIEWITRHPNAGFYNKGVMQVRPDGGSEVVNLFHEHRNLERILKKFGKDGTFKNFENEAADFGSAYMSSGDDLVYYVFDRETQSAYRGLSYSNLKAAATNQRDTFALLDNGEYVPYTTQSYQFIQNRIGANAQLYEGQWKEAGRLSPADITARITNARTGPTANMSFGSKNIQQMLDTAKEQNWVSRRYWNALDKLVVQEDELIRSYFTIQGGVKWTALPYGYWWAKKGFGFEDFSQYRLPDTWHDLIFSHGAENIYDYAYIDFFANAGSDQGDIFRQVLNKLPWTLVIDQVSEKYNPVKGLFDKLTKNQIRSETENLAFYMTGPEQCESCTLVLNSNNGLQEFNPFFVAKDEKFTAYILEDTQTKKARDKGQTLIAYASHMNLAGESGNDDGEPINLADAIRNEDVKTCAEAVEELNFAGIPIGSVLPDAVKKRGRIGGVLAGLESVTYGTFFWAGIFSTIAIQTVVAPQFNGCVDAEEGYYAHYFVPKSGDDTNSGSDATVNSTAKVSDLVDNFKETFVEGFQGDQDTFTKQAVSEIGDEIDKFVNNAKDNDIVQANLTINGENSGQLTSRKLFYFWCGEGCEINPASYKEEGKQTTRGVNGENVQVDFGKGVISVDGEPIVTTPDNVRMINTNLNIPAQEIPKTLTEICLENTTEIALEINAQGEVRVMNDKFLECIREGVLAQTGLPMASGTNKLNDVFGPLQTIITTTHPNVSPSGDKIIAEGVPRKVAEGNNAKVIILSNKDVNLLNSNDGDNSLGKLQSLQFQNGTIVIKPNGCFLAWLRHHADGAISKDLVEGVKTAINRETNPETDCEEPVVDFEFLADQSSPNKKAAMDKFNTSLQKLGPFSIFETPTQRFVISSERDETGECIDHLRVIDKNTGEVTDYTGNITQTPDGFKITTDDGQTHEVKFDTKDGVPMIQFDDNKPEVLTAAQGKNGSFYYDPNTGVYYAENAQLLPLIEAFRDGIGANVDANGEATATASGNQMNVNFGKDDSTSFLNLPSLPENKALLLLLLLTLIASFIYTRKRKQL